MSLQSAMLEACAAVQIVPPRYTRPGQWVQCPAKGKAASNGAGRVLVFDDGKGGIAWNWVTQKQQRFSADGLAGQHEVKAPARDPEREREAEAERREVVATCERIARACEAAQHPYLARKGFPDELGMVIEDPRPLMPQTRLGEAMAAALPESDGPLLVIPGRIAKTITTLQFITADGAKKNILRGQMSGASHRIATGRETWVCEGIATAMTIRAALRLLGRSATVLSAFSAGNVGKVASGLHGSVVAADHDAPQETLGGLGAGEYFAVKSGRKWSMPPRMGDFNDMQEASGIRSVALHLKEAAMG
tara:strand:+ start:9316 stop:10233 length:918 start_codon:yes stop_codon:yes gene_type:complete